MAQVKVTVTLFIDGDAEHASLLRRQVVRYAASLPGVSVEGNDSYSSGASHKRSA